MTRPFVDQIERCLAAPDETVAQVVRQLDQSSIGLCLIVDQQSKLLATVTDGDIRRAMLSNIGFDQSIAKVLELKHKSSHSTPVTASVDATNEALLELMIREDVQHVPLVDAMKRVVDVALLAHLVERPNLAIDAVVMAGGFGQRLRPLTQNTPKPMLQIGEKPVLERIIEQLASAGVRDVKISTHYLPDKIREHFGSGDAYGIDLDYVHEDQPLGTAGALGLMKRPNNATLIMNGDILSTLDCRQMLEFHKANKAEFTVAVRAYEVAVPFGVVERDGETVTGLKEKPTFSFFVNAGIYLAEPSVWDHIVPDARMDIPDLVDRLIGRGVRVVSFPMHEYWLDIGRPDDYLQAQRDFVDGKLVQ